GRNRLREQRVDLVVERIRAGVFLTGCFRPRADAGVGLGEPLDGYGAAVPGVVIVAAEEQARLLAGHLNSVYRGAGRVENVVVDPGPDVRALDIQAAHRATRGGGHV